VEPEAPARSITSSRIRVVNARPARASGGYVLYWMVAARRTRFNFALERAADWAKSLAKPLLVFEPLRAGYRWASQRQHRFVLDGMRANRDALARTKARYLPYVEPEPGMGRGCLAALAEGAAVVVTDDYPCFFLPRMLAAAGAALDVRLEAIDSNGLLPLAAAPRAFSRAFDFRRFLQRELPAHLREQPKRDPLARLALPPLELPRALLGRWPPAPEALLEGRTSLDGFRFDAAVAPVPFAGGAEAGAKVLERFVGHGLARYAEERNQVDVSSGLSPYLHYGHVGAHQVLASFADALAWTPERLAHPSDVRGAREGYWGMPPGAEAFLDQLVTWRELGFNLTSRVPGYERYDTLPDWARATLAAHAQDRRPNLYSLEQFDAALTYDPIWNAAQRQLRREGRIENYLRMLWGKKVLHWTRSPEEAFEILVELNNRYAVDGRDPNSYTGIRWIFGQFDRPWAPQREVFGSVRTMTSESTQRKLALKPYLERFGPSQALF
jgi:deoxyribodipyrimidine photo-lyase